MRYLYAKNLIIKGEELKVCVCVCVCVCRRGGIQVGGKGACWLRQGCLVTALPMNTHWSRKPNRKPTSSPSLSPDRETVWRVCSSKRVTFVLCGHS